MSVAVNEVLCADKREARTHRDRLTWGSRMIAICEFLIERYSDAARADWNEDPKYAAKFGR